MKLQDYKDIFNLDTEEKFMAHCKHYEIGIYSCPHCDEIIDPLDEDKICCWGKGAD